MSSFQEAIERARRGTQTAFVDRALARQSSNATDSFAGLAADLAHNVRQIRSVIDDGTYREAAAEVDHEEAWSSQSSAMHRQVASGARGINVHGPAIGDRAGNLFHWPTRSLSGHSEVSE